MESLITPLISTGIKNFEVLNHYRLDIGLKNENEQITATSLDLDGNVIKADIPAIDALYLTENGTMTIPSRPILDAIAVMADHEIEIAVNEIFDGVMQHDWGEAMIIGHLYAMLARINTQIPRTLKEFSDNISFVANHSDNSDGATYVVPINEFADKIICTLTRI